MGCLTCALISSCDREESELVLHSYVHVCVTAVTMDVHWLVAGGLLLLEALFSGLQGYLHCVPSLGLRVPGTDDLSLAVPSSMSPFSSQEALPPSRPVSQGSARGSQLPSCQ